MATRIDNPVSFDHQKADRIRALLEDYADRELAHAGRTKSVLIHEACRATASEARSLAADITASLYTWV